MQDILEEAELQRRGNDSDDGDDDRVKALLVNAEEGNTAEVVRLLEAKADVDGRDVSSAPRLPLPPAERYWSLLHAGRRRHSIDGSGL